MVRTIRINDGITSIKRNCTPEEEAALDAHALVRKADAKAEAEAKIVKQANRDSALAKLKALGLTESEVKDTFGLIAE
tara:strand:+ start:584 stop:817 length:234 start_codon:yes stop_codon:yes gene_type:complete